MVNHGEGISCHDFSFCAAAVLASGWFGSTCGPYNCCITRPDVNGDITQQTCEVTNASSSLQAYKYKL